MKYPSSVRLVAKLRTSFCSSLTANASFSRPACSQSLMASNPTFDHYRKAFKYQATRFRFQRLLVLIQWRITLSLLDSVVISCRTFPRIPLITPPEPL